MKPRRVFVCAIAIGLAGLGFSQVNPADQWRELMQKGSRLDAAGDYTGAVSTFREAVALAETSHDPRLVIALNSLANADDRLGRFSESEPLFKRALALAGRNGTSDPVYAVTLANLGAHYLESGQRDKARNLIRESLAIVSATMPPDSLQLALSRNALANVVLGDGQFAEAEKLIEASLETFRKHTQAGSEELAIGLNNLAVVREHQGKTDEANQLLQESIRITESELGPDHPNLVRALCNQAWANWRVGRRDEADADYQRALGIAEKRLGASHPLSATVQLEYAKFLRDSGRKAAAKTLEAQAHSVLRDHARTNGTGMTVDVSSFRH
jgi:tetratricopeptide (TPR) repeat protein